MVYEDEELNNIAADRRSSSDKHPPRWPVAAFAAAVTLVVCAAAMCEPSQAQTQSGPPRPERNSSSSQIGVASVEKTEKTSVERIDARPAAGQADTSTSSDAKNQSDTPFGSLGSSNRGPISIQSDSLALNYKQNAVLFTGHVHAAQADGLLTSNTLWVKYGKDFRDVQDMAADGNVHISQGVRWCTSDHAVMHQQQHTVTLTGSPICHDARDQIAGNKITVHLDTGKSDVEAAKAVIFPQRSKTRDNEALADHAK
jgi:lipopolysaccharide transport protein LptA